MERNWLGELVPIPILVLVVSKESKGMAVVEVAILKAFIVERGIVVVALL